MLRTTIFGFLFTFLVACSAAPLKNVTTTQETTKPIQVPVLLSFAGDTMMAGKVADVVAEKGTDYPLTDAAPIFHESDIVMLNVETAISVEGDELQKQYTFRSDPEMAKALQRAGVDVVTIANNHALDYGQRAFLDTIHYLDQAGIQVVGGGVNQEEAYASKTVEVKGKTIQFFGFSRVLARADWSAGHQHPGMASAYDPELVYRHVEPAIANSDYTVVYLHWGEELAENPLTYQVELAHGLIDRGVDLVIGSHPHVLQGMEWYKGKLIAYSLGNFVFTTSRTEVPRQSGILQVSLQDDKMVPKFIPMYIHLGAVRLANEEQTRLIMERLQRLSKNGTWKENMTFELVKKS